MAVLFRMQVIGTFNPEHEDEIHRIVELFADTDIVPHISSTMRGDQPWLEVIIPVTLKQIYDPSFKVLMWSLSMQLELLGMDVRHFKSQLPGSFGFLKIVDQEDF